MQYMPRADATDDAGHTTRPAEVSLRTVLASDRGEPVVIISLMNEVFIASPSASS